MSGAAPLLELIDIGKTYTTRRGEDLNVLSTTSMSLGSGEFVAIVGPSGCGKTTLLNIICKLTSPTRGRVVVHQERTRENSFEVGVVFQEPTLLLWRTVLQNVLLPVEIRGKSKAPYEERARALLTTLGLAGFEGAYPYELSGGMQQRVAIARALINDPTLLLMDEPFSALDAFTREHLNVELLRVWESTRKTILFVTHNMGEAVFLADRVIVMAPRPGRIVEEITINIERPRTADTIASPEYGEHVAMIRRSLKATGAVA